MEDHPTAKASNADGLLSPKDLASYLSCSRVHAAKLLADGTIPSFKIGSLRRVRKADVESYVLSQIALRDRA